MQSFPQPPSAKEEKEYLKKCKEGDWQARNQLIERNMRLVAYIAKKYQQSGVEMEDLISIGTIGLIKGVDSFREDKKIRLATYCARCVENEILMYLRSVKKTARDVYLFDTIGSDKEGNEINLFDVLEYEEEDIADRLTRKVGTIYGTNPDTTRKRDTLPALRHTGKGAENAEGDRRNLSNFQILCITY